MVDTGNELLSLQGNKLMYSTNKGRNWYTRKTFTSAEGTPRDIHDTGNEILLTTDKKLFYSHNKGRNWYVRSTF